MLSKWSSSFPLICEGKPSGSTSLAVCTGEGARELGRETFTAIDAFDSASHSTGDELGKDVLADTADGLATAGEGAEGAAGKTGGCGGAGDEVRDAATGDGTRDHRDGHQDDRDMLHS